MRFRHPEGARLALTNGQVALVDSEWRELPEMFYQEALVRGCEVDKTVIEARKDVQTEGNENGNKPFDETQPIREALELMATRGESGDFTGSGMPNLNVVSGLVKFPVKKEHVYQLWNELEAAKAAATTQTEPQA